MTREQAKQKLDKNCKKARELNMDAITFFATDMITHEIYSLTGFFDSGFEALRWARSKMAELDKYGVNYLCYEGGQMYEGSADFKFDED